MSLDSIETRTNTRFTQLEGFWERLQIEQEFIHSARERDERWPYVTGFYKNPEFALVSQSLLPCESSEVDGKEPPTFHDYLRYWIPKLKAFIPINRPLVLLDIGGGEGHSWATTAAKFEADIQSCVLAFVVSNLSWSPTEYAPERSLIHYINSTFRKLCGQSITLPDGRVLPLRGNVDLIHESHSLTKWSQVPELDILAIPGLLSSIGSYFISYCNRPCRYDLTRNSLDNQRQRIAAVESTWRLLEHKYNLKLVDKVEHGYYAGLDLLYKVFKRPTAPFLIEV